MKKTANRKAPRREETFPSSSELIVASALLLLSSTMTTTSPPNNSRKKLKTSSKSCLKAENVFQNSLEMIPDSGSRKLKAIETFITRFHQLKKIKVMRKKRSQTNWFSSGGSEAISSCKRAEKLVSNSGSGSTSAVSCLTNSSCVEFSEQSNVGLVKATSSPKRKLDEVNRGDTSNRIGSGHIRRRAEGILKVLATCGPASEVRIRDMLGNSPDTSKALRILLRRGEVKRHGAGGRVDPYTYSIA